MKALILAAGYNSRLKDIIDVPKTLLKIGSTTILERQINALMDAGFAKQDIFVVAGYKHNMIQAVHNSIIINEKYREYNNAYSVYLALKYFLDNSKKSFDEDIFIFDGDLVYDEGLIDQLTKSEKKNILVTKEILYSQTLKDEIILEKEDSEITEMIIPKRGEPLDEIYKDKKLFSFSGILKLSPEKAKELKNALENPGLWKTWYTVPLPSIVNKGGFYNFALPKSLKFCFDIDNKEDYKRLQDLNNELKPKAYKMFVAGPVNVSKKTKEAMVYSEIGHRESEFSDLFKDIKEKLPYAFGVNPQQYSTIVIGGSGTAATETLLSSILHKNKKTLVVSNGAFGERIAEICDLYKISILHLNYGWGVYPKLEEIEEKLRKNKEIEAVTMVLMETSTGMLNPVHETGKLCKKYNKIFIVDAISALGGEKLNMENDNIDYCLANTNKCLRGLPVFGIICFRKSSLEKCRDIKPRSYYLDFFKYIKYSEINQTPFTPQIPLFYMLRQALNELIEEGIENRIKRYENNGKLLKQKLREMGLKFQLKKGMSNLMVNILIPKNYTYKYLHDELKKRGYIIYPGKGPLLGKVIHLANIGTLNEEDVLQFCKDFKDILGK